MERGRWLDPDSLPDIAPNVPMWVCNCGNGPLADDEPFCDECADGDWVSRHHWRPSLHSQTWF